MKITVLLSSFRTYLTNLGLSSVSRKLYLADISNFLQVSHSANPVTPSVLLDPKIYLDYLNSPALAASPSLHKRTLSALKQFGEFVSTSYHSPNPLNNLTLAPQSGHAQMSETSFKYIKDFLKYLKDHQLTSTSLKSYKSDITQFCVYLESHHPSTPIHTLLNAQNLDKYTDMLGHSSTQSPSTIARKHKTIRRFLHWYKQSRLHVVVADNTTITAPPQSKAKMSDFSALASQFHAPAIAQTTSSTSGNNHSSSNFVKTNNYRNIKLFSLRSYITLSILLILVATLSVFGYRQFIKEATLTAAFPNTPVTPNRQLSFQGRLENASGTPVTSATNFVFKLYDASSGGTELYSSGTCSITPDTDGVFSTQIGSTCGSGITSSVFTENADVWLEITVAAETLTPRQQIATVAYALNSETLQGFPLSSTVSAIRNTVVPMNQWGEIIVGEQSPRLTGVSGTFQISAPSLTLTTATGTNGNITLAPDGTGQVNLNGNTTSTNFFNVSNAQLTTGSLITGTVANNNTGFKLLDLLSGSSPTSKFSVDDAGNTIQAGTLTLPNSNTITGVANYAQFSQGVSVGGGTTYYINSSGTGNLNALTLAGTLTANGVANIGDGGDAITLNGSSITLSGFNCTTSSNGGALTTNGSGVLQCSDDDGGGGGGDSYWRLDTGSLSPVNDTLDLLVGNIATSSAKAGFLNIGSGTPTATVSAGAGGGAYLTATGTLATTAKQTLTLGNTTTGNVVIAPGGTTALTANGSNLVAAGNLTLTAASNLFLGSTHLGATTAPTNSGAYLIGANDEFSNSNSTNVQGVLKDLDTYLSTALTGSSLWTDAGTYLYPTAGEVLGNSNSGGANKLAGIYLADSSPLVFGTDNDFSFSFNNSSSTLGSTLTSGTRFGLNTTSALATIDVRSSLGTIPVASISGSTSQAALIVDNTVGDLFTASSSGLSRFVITQNGNVGIGVTNPTNKLEIAGATSTISNDSGDITIDAASNNISFAGDSLINLLNLYASGELGIGVSDAIGRFHVHGATTGKALAILNELGDQDILTASTSGTTRFRLTNTGSLSLDGDYLNFGLTESSSGYGFRDNGGTLQFKHNGGSWADVGSGGASWWDQTLGTLQPYNKTVDLLLGGTATESAKIALINIDSGTPTATISAGTSGGIYINASGKIATTAKQSLELGDSTTTGNIILQGGNVGIGVAVPTQKLEVNGYIVGQRFVDSSSSSYYVDPASTGTSLSIDGNIISDGAFTISSNGNNNITIDAGSGTVLIGSTGTGKLDAGTIDPPYTINGEKFATYVSGMTGVKEETTGTVITNEFVSGLGYRATLDFANSITGSDLWLFANTTNLATVLDRLVVLVTASGNTKTWYEIDPTLGKLYLYSQSPTLLSYRLTAPRYDASTWQNTRGDDSISIGHVINNNQSWSVSEQIAAFFNRFSSGTLVSPLATSSALISHVPSVTPSLAPTLTNPEPLTINEEINFATISARTAYLSNVVAETITAQNIVADTITANSIIGLDAKIASLSSISDQDLESITSRIKDRLTNLTNPLTAQEIPAPPPPADDLDLEEWSNTPLSTTSATLASADIDFATINEYLAVIGQATITQLDVTNGIYTDSLGSKNNILALQPLGGLINLANGTLIVDSVSGTVAINGDLIVTGSLLADRASLNSLELGTPKTASDSSALGNLLSVYNEQGLAVATINASGSANLASLTTNMITIASAGSATDSSAISSLIGNTQSNATAGVATLTTPNTELTIYSPYVTPNSLVYLTPTTNTDNKVLFIQSKTTCSPAVLLIDPQCRPSFTVGIDTPASSDISFNWWIIELSPPHIEQNL